MRCFISLNLDSGTKTLVQKVRNDFKSLLDEATKDSIKWESIDKYHMTLFFLGDVESNILSAISDYLEKIEFSFDKIYLSGSEVSAFPDMKRPRVLIMPLEDKENFSSGVFEKICGVLNSFGFKPEKKFHPHITLGRVRRDKKINLLHFKDKVNFRIEFSVSDFWLMESKLSSYGSVYKKIKCFPF